MNSHHGVGDIDSITLRELVLLIGKVRVRTLISAFAVFAVVIAEIFHLGVWYKSREVGIILRHPFDMNLKNASTSMRDIYLVKDPKEPILPEHIRFVVRKFKEQRGSEEIGTVKAQKIDFQVPILWFFGSNEITNKAMAEESFEWHNHINNKKFYEEYVDENTIRRYYDDGWVLEYKVDENGDTVDATLNWVERGD